MYCIQVFMDVELGIQYDRKYFVDPVKKVFDPVQQFSGGRGWDQIHVLTLSYDGLHV